MKINLGCGRKYIEGFVNCDINKNTKADLYFDMECKEWPFKNNSVKYIQAYHVLEHLSPTGYLNAWQEMYRICKHNAIVSVRFPHHLHDNFYADPTHKTAVTLEGIQLFDKKLNLDYIEKGYSNSNFALEYNIDFRIIEKDFLLNPYLKGTDFDTPNLLDLTLHNLNIIQEVIIICKVYKPKKKL